MTDRRLAAVWLLSVAVLTGVVMAHAVHGTTAYFTDSHPGSIGGVNGTSTPNLSATVRIEPQTINLKGKGDGDVTAFIDGLPAPHTLSEIDLSSITLCYVGACIPSDGPAKFDGKAHVAATFTRSALAGLIGTDRGDLVLVVQGKLNGGGTFSGQATNQVTDGSDATTGTTGGVVPNALPAATPTPTPDVTATPTPTATETPALVATSTPAPTDTPSGP